MKSHLIALIGIAILPWRIVMAQPDAHAIRTYMSFAYPVDPASVKTLVDMDLSYALSTTLVDWSDSRSLSEGLAQTVDSKNERELVLKLKPQSKWSDGSAVTAAQVIRSIDHAKALHDEAMRGLFEMVNTIEAKDEHTLVFRLNRPVAQSQILQKLTEPVYGVVFIKDDGKMDLGKTTGPYILRSSSPEELFLDVNLQWYGFQKAMPRSVFIRQPKGLSRSDQDGFSDDAWPNIMSSSSLMADSAMGRLKEKHYSIWNRNLDRLFFFSPGARIANAEGRKLFQALAGKLNKKDLVAGLGGYHLSDQFFPPGYVLFDPEYKAATSGPEIPAQFTRRPLKLLAAEGRVNAIMKMNIVATLKRLTGQEPQFKTVPLNELFKAIDEGDYDILVMTLAVNDPNAEGPVSFIFGLKTPLIANGDGESGNFKARIIKARAIDEKSRNAEYRKVFTQAAKDGCLLPLFHFSSIVIARDGIDLSKVPSADETVAFSKVRFK